ncbi:class I SAM-dependent methyltransferase [Rubrivirga sp.]|uniref:class I SAM-dependent methyltransferase n=1 Tax=Rubrivirga sp. TaxID=1885344 RepID=UPI003B51B14E
MANPSLHQSAYPEARFGGFSRVDGTVAFYTRVQSLLRPDTRVLDVGCGRGKSQENAVPFRRDLRNLRGRCAHVLGIDVDPDAADNPTLDAFRLIEDVDRWPVDGASVDLVLSDYVLEHVEAPGAYARELARVLRPGGVFCARTPNKLGYVALVAQAVPNRLHARVVGSAQESRESHDVFPTFYRMNTVSAVRRALGDAFEVEVVRHAGEPTYFAFSPLAYRLGAVLHRLLPGPLQNQFFVFARKR